MIQIQFIGTGGAFDFEQGNSAALVEINGTKILIDCGHSVYPRLREKGLAGKIDYILLTHLHDDHAGSVSTLIFHQKYVEQKRAKLLHPNAEFGDHLYQYLTFTQQKPEEYSDFHPLWIIKGAGFIETTGMHVPNMMTFAYYFEDEDEIVVYSGDMGNPYLIYQFLEKKDSPKKVRVFHELTFYPNIRAHCYYKDLERLASKYEVYGYHVNPKDAPQDNQILLVANFPHLLL